MVVGIGVDFVEVGRIRAALRRAGFRDRVFTAEEIRECQRRKRSPEESFAARFAGKEAVFKALGRGVGQGGIGWKDVEILRGDGAPSVRLRGAAERRAEELHVARWHVALSHAAGFAVAVVIAESVGTPRAR
ncbi:MAG: holo-[acyl-carrier-protein] synthase [Candidatus Binatia bacterium]|nr:MAG: holo-[acyl-carrier-protein] synthase [Candidatus Binatia bacterium]